MAAKQLSVFIENRKGRLGEVLEVLKKNGISILSLSLADTTEYGLLRLIVNDPELCKKALSREGFSTMLSEVLVVRITHISGSLQELLTLLSEQDIGVEYMYGLSVEGSDASVVIKTSDLARSEALFAQNGVTFLSAQDLARM
ncbi:MAG: amino acid-binding protein [Clostridia bacterium]|nr:amino acid-binding protein [Clostridia bacterium]